MIDFRTDKQKARDARDAEIARYFADLKKQNPEITNSRIIRVMAEEGKHGVHSFIGVRQILVKTKQIHPTKRA